MSFTKQNLDKWNVGADTTVSVTYLYTSSTDNKATIIADGYFDTMLVGYGLAIGDLLWVVSSDDQFFLKVTQATTQVKTSIDVMPAGSVALGDLAIAQGSVMVGNASGAGVALDASGDTKVLVGNATTITSVALSGDVTMSNAGAVTIAANAVELAMLAAGITPSHLVKFAGKESNGGGSATVAITVAGVAATDIVFAQLEASTNAVNVQKVTPTTNTITVALSGDPGASTIISYQAMNAVA